MEGSMIVSVVRSAIILTFVATAAAPEASFPEIGDPAPSVSPAPVMEVPKPTPSSAPTPEGVEVCFAGRAYRQVGDLYVDDDGVAWKALRVTTTAYVPVAEQCDSDPEHTATGTLAQTTYGVAADPRALPYGTQLRIPGYGDVTVDDTGSRMVRSWRKKGLVHLDLRIPLRRGNGVWRDVDACNRIARKHGIQNNQMILVRVGDNTVAAVAWNPH
jgi:3D (Asp-Asp-Asp) domain-containing protein